MTNIEDAPLPLGWVSDGRGGAVRIQERRTLHGPTMQRRVRLTPEDAGPYERPRDWDLAVHESAHAVIAAHVGMAVRQVSIAPDGGRHDGETWHSAAASPWDRAVVCLAGVAACKHFGVRDTGSAADRRAALRAIGDESWPSAERNAMSLVVRYHDRIVELARALVSRRKLVLEELDRFLPGGAP